MTAKQIVIKSGALQELCAAALERAGARSADAAASARILVAAELMGIATHGAIRVPDYTRRLRSGGIDAKAQPRLERRAASLALLDGANALGPAVGVCALQAAIEIAGETGIGWVGCQHSNHFGALAPYALDACEAGYVMIASTNASVSMPPWGGTEPRLGNNPLAIAAPCAGGRQFILDMAMSVAARGKIRAARAAGVRIPEGWATDGRGRPTTDPAAALAGFLLPFGAHKGSGLAMAVDVLAGALSGARFLTDVSPWINRPGEPQGLGHFFLLLDPARLIGREAFAAAMARFRHLVCSTPSSDAARPVHTPGDDLLAHRERALAEGVLIAPNLLGELQALAR